jgi:hypothetical protein
VTLLDYSRFQRWVAQIGESPSDIELALYIVDYVAKLGDKIGIIDAAVLREAARRILGKVEHP